MTGYSLLKLIAKSSSRTAIFAYLTGLIRQETKIPVARQLTLGVVNISIQANVTSLCMVVYVSMQKKDQVQQLHM